MLLSGADNPQLTARGGMLAGLPAVTSNALPDDAGNSPLVLVDAARIAFAQDPAFAVSIADSATLQLANSRRAKECASAMGKTPDDAA